MSDLGLHLIAGLRVGQLQGEPSILAAKCVWLLGWILLQGLRPLISPFASEPCQGSMHLRKDCLHRCGVHQCCVVARAVRWRIAGLVRERSWRWCVAVFGRRIARQLALCRIFA